MPARPRPKARAKAAAAPASKPVRKRGPNKVKPAAAAAAVVSERPFSKSAVAPKKKRVERSYSKQRKAEVVFWMHSQRFYDPFNPASEGGWRRPTMRETGRHFSIPWTTLGSWYRNRHKFVEGLSPPPEGEAEARGGASVATPAGGAATAVAPAGAAAAAEKGGEGQVPSAPPPPPPPLHLHPPPVTAAPAAAIPASSMPRQAFQYAPAPNPAMLPNPMPLHGVAARFSATVPPRGMPPVSPMSGMPPPPG